MPSRRRPEAVFQAWCDRLIDRIVLPPMFTSAIEHAGKRSQATWNAMAARGLKAGLPDLFVTQNSGAPIIAWFELKRGSPVSSAQEGVHIAMRRTGQRVFVARTMDDIVHSLRISGFCLHAQADELAREYEVRCAAQPKRAAGGGAYKPDSKARIRKAAAIYAAVVLK